MCKNWCIIEKRILLKYTGILFKNIKNVNNFYLFE